MIVPDGIQAAADREREFHPTRTLGGKTAPISAWDRRAKTIQALVDETNRQTDEIAAMRLELEALKARLESLPF